MTDANSDTDQRDVSPATTDDPDETLEEVDERIRETSRVLRDGGQRTRSFRTSDERPTVSYGPKPSSKLDEWVLSLSCESGRVEITLDEEAMYQLWIEVRGVPWPDPEIPGEESRREQDRLVRQVVHAANGADTEMLRDALEALGVRR